MARMDWLISDIKNDTYNKKFRICETGRKFGTIYMPTGVGKSGVMIYDIVHHIRTESSPIIVNIACPILRLTQQVINDLLEVLDGLGISSDDINFLMNSSDDSENYEKLEEMKINTTKFYEFDKLKKKKIVIIASCHKSLYKFINKSDELSKDYKIFNYIDESHCLSIFENISKGSNYNDDDDIIDVDFDELCKNSTSTFDFSATPEPQIRDKILEYEPSYIDIKDNDSLYVIFKKPIEAINENIIRAPRAYFEISSSDCLLLSDLIRFMEIAKKENPLIKHKVLVSLSSSDQLREMEKNLVKKGYKVYSTCSKYGFTNKSGYDSIKDANITKFVKAITDEPDDCFVLHIRQLIAGIDIKCLTDCVMFSRDHGKQEKYRTVIQTIGRVLRPLDGERGKSVEDSLKKYGGVFFVSAGNESEYVENGVKWLLEKYYGLCYSFERAFKKGKDGIKKDKDYVDNTIFGNMALADSDSCIYKVLMGAKNDVDKRLGFLLKNKSLHVRETYLDIKKLLDKSEMRHGLGEDNKGITTDTWYNNYSFVNTLYTEIPKLIEKNYNFFDYNLWRSIIGELFI